MCNQIKLGVHTVEAGTTVRPEYLNLPRDLRELARGFNLDLPLDCRQDAAVLVFAIECVDRVLDSLPHAAERAQFAADVLMALEGNATASDSTLPAEVQARLSQLQEVIHRRNIAGSFRRITRRILRNSERMRTTRRPASYIEGALAEGRWMVELLLLVLGGAVTPRFRQFMRQLAGPANLGDKLRDARHDFILGELAIKPGLVLHLRLICGMLWRILALAFRFCAYRQVLTWGLKSLYHELALPRQRAA